MRRITGVAVALLAGAGPLVAQITVCPPGKVVVPYFGWNATSCVDCRVFGSYLEYLKEPQISDIREHGPADGKLRDHDTLVAVGGTAITDPVAWHALRDAKPGAPITLTVRRDGALVTATIIPSATCGTPGDARPRKTI